MDTAFEFLVNGPNMDFILDLMLNGHEIPNGLFCGHFDRKMSTHS